MRFATATEAGGTPVLINPANVAYIMAYEDATTIHFVGAKDSQVQVKETAREIGSKIEAATQ